MRVARVATDRCRPILALMLACLVAGCAYERPLVPATLALIEHRNKSHDLAVATVRDAPLDMRENAVIAPLSKRTRQVARPRVA